MIAFANSQEWSEKEKNQYKLICLIRQIMPSVPVKVETEKLDSITTDDETE